MGKDKFYNKSGKFKWHHLTVVQSLKPVIDNTYALSRYNDIQHLILYIVSNYIFNNIYCIYSPSLVQSWVLPPKTIICLNLCAPNHWAVSCTHYLQYILSNIGTLALSPSVSPPLSNTGYIMFCLPGWWCESRKRLVWVLWVWRRAAIKWKKNTHLQLSHYYINQNNSLTYFFPRFRWEDWYHSHMYTLGI